MNFVNSIYSISKKRFLSLLGGLICLIGIGGYLFYSHEALNIRNDKYNELNTIIGLKGNQIEQWFKERFSDVNFISKSPGFYAELTKGLPEISDLKLRQDILKKFNFFCLELKYEDVFLLTPDGSIILSTHNNHEVLDTSTLLTIRNVKKEKKIIFTDLYLSTTNQIQYDIVTPILDSKNDIKALVVFRRNAKQFFFNIISSWPAPSKSAETALIRVEKDSVVFLNELRFKKGSALKFKLSLKDIKRPAVQAALGNKGILDGVDYRGINVLSMAQKIQGTNWILITKIDKDEVFHDIYITAGVISSTSFLLILLSGLGMGFFYNTAQKNIFKELYLKENQITKQQNMLELSEFRFQRLVSQLNDVVWTSSLDGSNIVEMNDSFESVYGLSKEEMRKNPNVLKEIVHPEDCAIVEESSKELFETGKTNSEYRIVRPDGEIVWLLDRKSIIYDDNGKPLKIGGIVKDITERKNFELELLAAKEKAEEMNRLKSTLIAHMSHELHTPLIGIIGFADLLVRDLSDPDLKEMAENILIGGKRLTDTINLILSYSKIEAEKQVLKLVPIDIIKETQEIIQFFKKIAENKSLSLQFSSNTISLDTHIDLHAYHSIMNNLIGNAIKYTDKGSVNIDFLKNERDFIIKVTDTGIGISKDNYTLIFDEFRQVSEGYKRDFEGIGLGLSMTKKLVEKLGGEVSVDSELGKGSVFTVMLPLE